METFFQMAAKFPHEIDRKRGHGRQLPNRLLLRGEFSTLHSLSRSLSMQMQITDRCYSRVDYLAILAVGTHVSSYCSIRLSSRQNPDVMFNKLRRKRTWAWPSYKQEPWTNFAGELLYYMDPMPPAGVKILFLLGWMDVVVARSRQVVVLAM